MGLYLPPKRRVLCELHGVANPQDRSLHQRNIIHRTLRFNYVNTFKNMVCILYRKFAFDKILNSNILLISSMVLYKLLTVRSEEGNMMTVITMSRVRSSVTNNNGIWIG
jgi:hypothetical protein